MDTSFQLPVLPALQLCKVEAARPCPATQKYKFGEDIGGGSIGLVQKATRRRDGKLVAAKTICTQDLEKRIIWRQEYELMCSLNHESIVLVEDFCEDSCQICLFMELCENGCVESYVQANGPFGQARARDLIAQLTSGIAYLHSKSIVHCDMKPANLFLRKSAEVLKIGDFNSAKRLHRDGQRPDLDGMLSCRGTPLLQAPEVRFKKDWDERIDIWGLGMSAYFMLQSALPFGQSQETDWLLEAGCIPDICLDSISGSMRGFLLQSLSADMLLRPSAAELCSHPALVGAAATSDQSPAAGQSPCPPSGNEAPCADGPQDAGA